MDEDSKRLQEHDEFCKQRHIEDLQAINDQYDSIKDVSWGDKDKTMIRATINGVTMFIPDDLCNRHRAMIKVWEDAGNSITAFKQSAK